MNLRSEPLHPWFDVTDFGAKGTDTDDDTLAIEYAINKIPKNVHFLGNTSDRIDHGYILYFPTPLKAYRMTHPIHLPNDKNIRLLGDTIDSARIHYHKNPNDCSDNYAFVCEGGKRRAYVFENLYFHGGGVLLAGNGRNVTDFIGCGFTDIGDYGIKTAGRSIVGVRVMNCEFAETSGGVGILDRACDNWIIGDNTKFVRLDAIGVECHSSGVTIRDARFESKAAGHGAFPHIAFEPFEPDETPDPDNPLPEPSFAGGLSEVTGCRFGSEVGTGTDGPPEFAIRLGPAVVSYGTMTGIMISRNRFLRRGEGGPTTTSGYGAIRLTKAVKECVVMGNHFQEHTGPLIHEDYTGGNPRDNYFTANAIDTDKHKAGIFSGTATGWIVQQTAIP
jgi:hypothetical protein